MIPKLAHTNPLQDVYLRFLNKLQASSFQGDICRDYGDRTVLATDNSVYQVLPEAVLYPKNRDDLVRLTELANQPDFHCIVLSPRGGGTGTNGQSLTNGLVVDLSRHMHQILEINAEQGWARVQCGAVKDQLNAALAKHNLFFAPELSTSNRATIGGMINTDASGQGSCLYGKTRDHVLELTCVLLDGSVIHSKAVNDEQFNAHAAQQDKEGLVYRLVNAIEKEHAESIARVFPKLNRCLTGYDLAHIRDQQQRFNLNSILCGSEGTLGFITEAKIRVLPIPKHCALVVVKYTDFGSSLADAQTLMQAGPTSIETIDSKVLNLAMKDFIWHQVETFFEGDELENIKGINLVEYTDDDPERLHARIEKLLEKIANPKAGNNTRLGYALASGQASVNKIWAMRKRAVGLLGNTPGQARPVAFVEDTAVPPEHLADFIQEFRALLDSHQLDYGMFGHVDAGVLHVRPALDMKDPKQEQLAWEISDRVAELTQRYHGLLWGEHGKGVRSQYAPKFFGELYPQLQRIKAAFDPYNQMNPGKIATPAKALDLLQIREVPTRGSHDRMISRNNWDTFADAVYCNGNGACFNWDSKDAMCPSWKATRKRTHSPKGRASLIREWLKLLSLAHTDVKQTLTASGSIKQLARKTANSIRHLRGEYDFSHEVYESMAGCLACKACAGTCPVKVNVPEFRSQFLALYHTRYLRPLKDYLVASLEFLLPYCDKIAPVYNVLMDNRPSKYLQKHILGFVDGPTLSRKDTRHLKIADIKALTALSKEQKDNTVILAQDAFTRYFETDVVIDTYALLEKLGFNVYLAPFNANGKPLHVHGFLTRFTKTAKKNAQTLMAFSKLDIALVGIDPSMTLTYRSEYKKYLDPASVPEVQLLQEWLSSKHTVLTTQKSRLRKGHYKLLPHCTEKTNASESCNQWLQVFERLGQQLDVVEAGCCGMSGTYGHEARNRTTSAKIYKLSWQEIIGNNNAETLLATGYSCRSQIKREDAQHIRHPAQALLAQFMPEKSTANI